MEKRMRTRAGWVAIVALMVLGALPARALQIGSRPAAEWIPHLEDPGRVAGLKIDEVVKRMKLQPGMVVADIGSGSGVFTRSFSRAVAPSGRAVAVDIDPALLSYVSESAGKEGIKNIETHLAPTDDAKLSGPILDVAFFHDVFHHIEHRDQYVKNLARYMKPTGRIVIIERASHGGHHEMGEHDPNANMHRMMEHHGEQVEMASEREKVDEMMAAAGFAPVEEFDLFGENRFFVVYGRK